VWRTRLILANTAGMEVVLSAPSAADAADFIDAVRASRALHHPWLDLPDTPGLFAAYLERAAREDQAAYLIRQHACGGLVGFANVNAIVRGDFQPGYLGYGAFASHAGRGLMTEGLRAVLRAVFGELRLHRVEANIQPGNTRSTALAARLGFTKEGFSRRCARGGGVARPRALGAPGRGLGRLVPGRAQGRGHAASRFRSSATPWGGSPKGANTPSPHWSSRWPASAKSRSVSPGSSRRAKPIISSML
jgi:[ribosomal protein S5]-alanine N-acetyltransferase